MSVEMAVMHCAPAPAGIKTGAIISAGIYPACDSATCCDVPDDTGKAVCRAFCAALVK